MDATSGNRTAALRATEPCFRDLVERNADGVVVVDRQGIIRFVNPAAETLLGHPAEALLGQLFGLPLSPGETTDLDIPRPGGPARIAEMRVVESTWEGEPIYLASLRDITERKQQETAARFLAEASTVLAGSLDYLKTLASVARLAVAHLADWCLIDLVEAGGQIHRVAADHGDPAKEARLRRLRGLYPLEPDAPFGLAAVLRSGAPETYPEAPPALGEVLALVPEHRHLICELGCKSCLIVPLTAHGRMLGAITLVAAGSGRHYGPADLALAVDLAHRAALAVDNARLYDEAREANRRKDEFLAMLAHELRNPLASIQNGLHLLALAGLDERTARRAREVAERQVRHLARLVDDLLDVSRVTRGKVQLRKEVVDVATVVGAAVEAARPLLEAHRHQLSVSLPAAPLRLEADPARLEQVLVNLLHNAAKYTEDGGHVWVSAGREGSQVVVRVRDTGIGIPAEVLPHVFELFTQADRSLDRAQGGLGIGLTLVKSLVELHGGSVQAASAGPGRGSEFIIRLPAPPQGTPAPTTSARPTAPAGAEPAGRCRKVLLVEDQREAAEMLGALIRLWGHQVRVAHDGPTALAAAPEFRPDVVLLDIGLPGMNGYELARRLRELPGLDRTLLVALTGYGREEDRRRALEAGFHHHLVKPVSPNALEQFLGQAEGAVGGNLSGVG